MLLLYHDPKAETKCSGTTVRITGITTTQGGTQIDCDRENKVISLEKTVAELKNEIECLKVTIPTIIISVSFRLDL